MFDQMEKLAGEVADLEKKRRDTVKADAVARVLSAPDGAVSKRALLGLKGKKSRPAGGPGLFEEPEQGGLFGRKP